MYTYLQPTDDGLPMRSSGPWAAEKLDYLRRYIDIFETSMREKWPIRNYIDLLAGPGKNCVRDTGQILLGSPLLALTTTHPFTGYYFVDFEQTNVDALQERCRAAEHSDKVRVFSGDCNVVVNRVLVELTPEASRSLNLAFLDSEGLELRWDTVAKLASLKRMDLIINYPQGGLNRMMPQAIEEDGDTLVDDFFGGEDWRTIYKDWQVSRGTDPHWRLLDLYKSRLQGVGYKEVKRDDEVGDEPLMRNAKRNAPLYRLLFASKHPLGNQFWHKVTRRDVHGQLRLLDSY
jgi:three-Cys-motif partner protein